MNLKTFWGWIILPAFLLGCAGVPKHPVGYEEMVQGGERPKWVFHPTEFDTKSAKAFVGTSLDFAMEGQARDDAIKNARKQIIDAMGVYGKRKISEIITNTGLSADIINPAVVTDDATKLVSEATVATRAKDWVVEKWMRAEAVGVKYYYRVFVLVIFNNGDADKAVKDAIRREAEKAAEEQNRQNIERALELMEELKSADW